MKTCIRSPVLMLKMIYLILPVMKAQQLKVLPEVTGYLGQDVTLPCEFIQESKQVNITQSQWYLLQQEGEPVTIIVFSSQFGINIPDSPLKGRVEPDEQSLIIKDVEMRDAGSYRCTTLTFPLGAFDGTTNLVVREHTEQMHILPRLIATAIFVLIIVTMAATTYVIITSIRRDSSAKHHVCTDTAGPVLCD